MNQNARVRIASRAVKSAESSGAISADSPCGAGVPSTRSPYACGVCRITAVSGSPTAITSRPEPNAVARQPNISIAATVRGTISPPTEKPICESASAFARWRLNQLTSATVIDRKPTEAGAERHQEEREVERHDRVDTAEEDEAGAEHHDPDAHHCSRAETVDGPALQRSEQAALQPRHGERSRERGQAPAIFFAEQQDVSAERLHQQRADQHLHAASGQHHPPAVEDVAVRPQGAVDRAQGRPHEEAKWRQRIARCRSSFASRNDRRSSGASSPMSRSSASERSSVSCSTR